MRVEKDWRGIGEGTDGGARGKRGLFGKEDGGCSAGAGAETEECGQEEDKACWRAGA